MNATYEHLPDRLPDDPLEIANAWLAEAWQRQLQPNPNAMVLATVDARGQPSARVVLCKEITPRPGYLVFYTNYHSRKGRELAANPRAAVVLHWDHLQRQVRIEGPVVKAPEADSDAYFASRSWQRRLGAWASRQSEPLESREALLAAVTAEARRFGAPIPGQEEPEEGFDITIPRPPHWGGYRLWAESVELWIEGHSRIHDRARWTRTLTPRGEDQFEPGPWSATRLQP